MLADCNWEAWIEPSQCVWRNYPNSAAETPRHSYSRSGFEYKVCMIVYNTAIFGEWRLFDKFESPLEIIWILFDISEDVGVAVQTVREPEVRLHSLRHPSPCFRLWYLFVLEEHVRRLPSHTVFDTLWCIVVGLNALSFTAARSIRIQLIQTECSVPNPLHDLFFLSYRKCGIFFTHMIT
jgi:hypothetical protein